MRPTETVLPAYQLREITIHTKMAKDKKWQAFTTCHFKKYKNQVLLMFKMTQARYNHCQIILFAILN